MPYRIKEGQEVLLIGEGGITKIVKFNRTVDFDKNEILTSPLDEHQDEGISSPSVPNRPWGINISGRWEDVGTFTQLYAAEVHEIPKGFTPKDAITMTVQGSGTNQYTIILDRRGEPMECSCRGYRFKRKPCKHMKQHSATL